jgi:hypothetical protein
MRPPGDAADTTEKNVKERRDRRAAATRLGITISAGRDNRITVICQDPPR